MTPHKDSFPDPRPPAPTLPQPSVLSEALQVCHPHTAGIDIGEAEHWVAVPPGCDPQPVRRFGTCTVALDTLAAWLMDCGVTTVAMASTGVDWMPVFELLETRGVQGLLRDPRQAKRAPGRPNTDRLACQWLQRLHTSGLLAGAFRPEDQVGVLRRALRHRQMRLTSAAQPRQHMPKALQQMHRKRTQGVRALTGVTGMAILKAISAGERPPVTLAKLRHPHCHHDADAIAKALPGSWRAEHLVALRQAVALYDVYHQQMAQGDQQITRPLETFADHSAGQPLPPKARRHTKTNAPRCDARTPLSRMAGVDLTTIEGSAEHTAFILLSAIGTDLHRWPSVKHCCRWLGLGPQHQISGGKVLSRRGRPGAHRVTVALRLAARSLHHAQRALGAFLRRMQARLGTPKAITATAHTLARLVSSLRHHGSASVQQGLEAYAAPDRARQVTTMAKQAKALGYTLVPRAAQGEARCPGPLRSRPSSSHASHALRCHMSQGLRGRYVPRTPRQPPPPVHRGSPTAATPSKILLTLAKTLLTLLQKGLTSRRSSLGGRMATDCALAASKFWHAHRVMLGALRHCLRFRVESDHWDRHTGSGSNPFGVS